jgi:predicted nuclease with TOPRIM domain
VTESYTRPDEAALEELERLLSHVAEELAGWRRRCLKSESDLQELRARGGVAAGSDLNVARDRVVTLEQENAGLRQRVELARERVTALASRLSFLEQGREVES